GVVATDLDAASAAETARLIRESGGSARGHGLDVTAPDDCRALVGEVAATAGGVDLLVNNAGIIVREGIDSPEAPANWRRTIDVIATGTFNVTGACIASLRTARGTVVNTASIASVAALPGSFGYSPSKAAIRMLTQSLAGELAADGVRVNALAPGV